MCSAGARLHADRPVGIDPQASPRRRGAGEIAHEAVALAHHAGWLRHGRQRQQQENRECLKIYRATHSCP